MSSHDGLEMVSAGVVLPLMVAPEWAATPSESGMGASSPFELVSSSHRTAQLPSGSVRSTVNGSFVSPSPASSVTPICAGQCTQRKSVWSRSSGEQSESASCGGRIVGSIEPTTPISSLTCARTST